ncbi:putative kinase [Gemmobacter caeni]|uniref:Putative kinase n=1 Tax=Gemmobacter caeni TaxID=589035 RepID=A0A2T6B9A3_9RHOB|nr:AAA family ATPase [Gemmobacter caeni]PTX52639.1 putative kinase [Gemmobacter caeni]TWI94906.1 putative kinase [Gemmobacter caeni]
MGWIDMARRGAGRTEMAGVFPWFQAMDACAHDPVHHAEGSPWEHTARVVEALEADPTFRAMRPERQEVLRVAAWSHDIGKPATTVIEEEGGRVRVRQPGHAALGARMIWQHLIDEGAPVRFARDVHALVAWHMRPSHLIDQGFDQTLNKAIRFSIEAGEGGWAELLALCEADQNGRISLSDGDKLFPLQLLRIALQEVRETHQVDLLEGPWPFKSDTSRLRFLRGDVNASPWFTPPDPTGPCVTILSGLPGSGKDSWLRANRPELPVVSLDRIREGLGVGPTENQGAVLQSGFEAARVHLRSGQDFAWNATCLTRLTRQKIVGLARDYDASVQIVSLDVPTRIAMERNRGRGENAVPDQVITHLALKREPPTAEEAHDILSVNSSGETSTLRCRGTERASLTPEDPDLF